MAVLYVSFVRFFEVKLVNFNPFLFVILDKIQFDQFGLIPAITQDYDSGKVLMFAWMNRESLMHTIETKQAVYYSRSRKKLWFKGEKSGHTQLIKDIYIDCDCDVILLKVEQTGGIACHTGRHSCFFQKLADNTWCNVADVIKDPDEIYG